MASCEKCWEDANGDPKRYAELVVERLVIHCTPEQQAGRGATLCPVCNRKTLHQICGVCMNCGETCND